MTHAIPGVARRDTAPWQPVRAAAQLMNELAPIGPAVHPWNAGMQQQVAGLLNDIAHDMENQGAREQLMGDQHVVVDRRFRQPHDVWTTALNLARDYLGGTQ
jgi:hypothetical protein